MDWKGLLFAASLFLALGVFIGCEEETATEPLPKAHHLQIEARSSAISAREDDARALAVDVRCLAEDGSVVEGVAVTMRVVSGPGEVAPGAGLSDRQGLVRILYFVTLPYGDTTTTLRAIVEGDSSDIAIALHGDPAPSTVELTADPAILSVSYSHLERTLLYATVRDRRGSPLPGVNIGWNVQSGVVRLGPVLGLTDANGVAHNIATVDGYWFGTAEITALVTIPAESSPPSGGSDRNVFRTAGSDGTLISDTLRVEVRQVGRVYLEFPVRDTLVYTNSNQDRLILRARLADTGGETVSGATINFSATSLYLSVTEAAITDPFGTAIFEAHATGTPGRGWIYARYSPLDLIDSMSVTVVSRSPQRIALELESRGPTRWADSSYRATVRVQGINGEPLYHIPTRLQSQLYAAASVVLTGEDGIAVHSYYPSVGGGENLRAEAVGYQLASRSQEFTLFKWPAQIAGSLEPSGGPEAFFYRFRVLDANYLGVPGEVVRATIDMGRLTRDEVVTDSLGRGEFGIFSGDPGVYLLALSWRGQEAFIEVPIVGRTLGNMIVRAEPLNLSARGSGGLDTTAILSVLLFDQFGDTLLEPRTVYIGLVDEPAVPMGCTINGRSLDSVVTSNGLGEATLFAGSLLGEKLIQAYSFRDVGRQDTVRAILSTVAVVAGPPGSISLHVDDEPRAAAGGRWQLETTALIRDLLGNPVRNGIPVAFSFMPQPVLTTGPGAALANYLFDAGEAFQIRTVWASTESPRGAVSDTARFQLPPINGLLSLEVDSSVIHISRDEPLRIHTVRLTAYLTSAGEPANGGLIHFTAARGQLNWWDEALGGYRVFPPDSAVKLTGIVDEHNDERPGEATVYLRGAMNDFFLDAFTDETIVQVIARVDGFDIVSDPVILLIRR
ncbi:MAG: hypothetical protein FJY67_09605 [Calditrichaeota bacterium]|nr:hypothetical protein [Calditrichota bacterium]